MSVPGRTEFLDRRAYRQRRLRDAARVLPFFALVFVLLPLLWPVPENGGARPSALLSYVFGFWIAFVAVLFLLSRQLEPDLPAEQAPDEAEGEGRT